MPRKQTPANPSADNADPKTYNEVVGRTHIRGIRLLESKFDMKPDALVHDPDDWQKGINFELGDVVVSDNGTLYGIVTFDLVCKKSRRYVLRSKCRYLVHYKVDGPCSQADGELFIARVGRLAVYPYFRSLVATLVAEAGITLPPLPVYSLAPRSLASAANLVATDKEKEITW